MSGGAFTLMGKVEALHDLSRSLITCGVVLSVVTVIACSLLPRLMRRGNENLAPGWMLMGVVFSRIVFGAGYEAAGAFWATLAVLLEDPIYLLGPAICVVILVAFFPTKLRLEKELGTTEEKMDRLLEEEMQQSNDENSTA